MKIKEIRKLTQLSRVKFAEKYNIPLPTMESWERELRTPPAYVKKLLEFKVKYDLENDK